MNPEDFIEIDENFLIHIKPFEPVVLEYRLYYDEEGSIICYTTEKLEGNYIVIDKMIYAEGRFDIRVIDGKIIKASDMILITKMAKSLSGTKCASVDVNILVDDEYEGEITHWDIERYEFRNY